MIGILRGLITTMSTHFRRPVTVQYPDERLPLAPRYMGFPTLIYDEEVGEPRCTGCQICMRNCPNTCITVTMKDNEKAKEGKSPRKKIVDQYELDYPRCMLCSICVEVCPFDAIKMSHLHEFAADDPANVVFNLDQLLDLGKIDLEKRGGN